MCMRQQSPNSLSNFLIINWLLFTLVDRCIERLQLAGGGGWISVRLNRPPPNDDLVVEAIGVDGNYDPDNPGIYHLDAQRRLRQYQQQEKTEAGTRHFEDLSSIESAESDTSHKNKMNVSRDGHDSGASRKCLICLTEDRNATIVHGETGHVACCLICARILKARGDKVQFLVEIAFNGRNQYLVISHVSCV